MQGRIVRVFVAGLFAAFALLAGSAVPGAAVGPYTITGRVTDGAGNGVADVNVSAYTGGAGATCCSWITGVNSDATGSYTITLAPGTYRIQFYPAAASTFVSRWWSATGTARLFDQATDIDLSANTTLPDTALETGFLISGTVTDASGPLANVNVSAYTAGACCSWVAAGVTSATGTYSFRVPTASYRLQFYPPQNTTYIAEWWDGAAGGRSFEAGVDISVTANVTGKDAVLTLGRRLSGTVTNGTTAVQGANASVFAGGAGASCCTWITGSSTDAAGAFSLVVPDGTYRLSFNGPSGSSLIAEWWDGGSGVSRFELASDIVVSADRAGLNAALVAGSRISGRITSDGVTGIPGAGVGAFTGGTGAFCCTWIAGAGTDAGGNYSLVVPAGTYRIQFHAPRGSAFVSEWWNAGTGAARFDLATDVDASTNVTAMDAVLGSGLRISGRVTSDGTTGIAGVGVSAFTGGTGAFCCTWISGTGTDSLGNYTLVVPAGIYRIQFYAPRTSAFLNEWWNGGTGASRFDLAADISVGPDVSGRDATLETGLRISGRVTSDGTNGIAAAGVSAFTGGSGATCCTWISGTGTDSLGNYSLVVPAGTYRIQFYPPRTSSFISQWWTGAGGATTFNAAQDIGVSENVSGKDAVLASGLRITGRVTSGGAGVGQVGVSAYVGGSSATCCTWVSGTGTDAAGNYALTVPAGTYRLQFWPPRGSSFLGQWWAASGGVSRFDQASDVAVSGDVSVADVALQSGEVISGRVTASGGTTGIAGAGVSAFVGGSGAVCCTWTNGTGTDNNGNYSLALPAGTYRLQIYAPRGSDYLSEWWTAGGGTTDFGAAGDIVLGGSALVRDVSLDRGVPISGTVSSSTGPIQGVWVTAMICSGGCTWVAGGSTGSDGRYSVAVPGNATYKLQFHPPQGSPYVGQWYGGGSGTDVVVGTDPVIDRNATLATGLSIRGTVTNGSIGLANANVNAQTCDNNGRCNWVAGTRTDGAGAYQMVVPPGTYKINVHPPFGSSYVGEWYQDATNPTGAQDVVVTSADRALDPVVLATGYAITGRVISDAASPTTSGIASANVGVMTCDNNGFCNWISGGPTATDGTYRITVPPGTYKVNINPPHGSSYVGEWYQNATSSIGAQDVVVTNADRALDPVVLVIGYVISGTVTSDGTAGIANVNVSAQINCGNNGCQFVAGANTGANGTYRLVVPANTYKIQFNPPHGSTYIGEWYNDKTSPTAADGVPVTTGNVPGINAILQTGYVISGTVTSDGTAGIANVNVSAQINCGQFGCQWVAGANTNSSGVYSLVVPANTYKIQFNPPQGSTYLGEWYNDKASPTDANGVPVTTGNVPGINATLATGVAITGRVISDAANPTTSGIANVHVSAQINCGQFGCQWVAGANTGANGAYTLIVPQNATYKIQFNPPQGSTYLGEWYNDKTNPTAADGVQVTTGNVPDINATLATGYAITGRVTSDGTAGIASVNVSAQVCPDPNSCSFVAGTNTAADGTYRLVVPPNSYFLRFNPPQGSPYVGEWYNDARSTPDATPVVVTTADVGPRDAVLAIGFAVTGTVTRASDGQPIAGANVSARLCAPTCAFFAGTQTAGNGTYSLLLPNGTYKLFISANTFTAEWYNDKTSEAAADPVTVNGASQTLQPIVLAP